MHKTYELTHSIHIFLQCPFFKIWPFRLLLLLLLLLSPGFFLLSTIDDTRLFSASLPLPLKKRRDMGQTNSDNWEG